MKIEELYKPKELDDFRKEFSDDTDYKKRPSRNSLSDKLKKFGFSKIGEGWYAKVYSHEKYPDSIFKIFYDDPDTLKWIKFCLNNKGNPYLPNIRSAPIKIANGLYLVRMEKLVFKSSTIQQKFEDIFDAILTNDEDDIIHIIDHSNNPKLLSTVYNDPKFKETFNDIRKLTGQIDLHAGNFMWRGDQLVFTDPISS